MSSGALAILFREDALVRLTRGWSRFERATFLFCFILGDLSTLLDSNIFLPPPTEIILTKNQDKPIIVLMIPGFDKLGNLPPGIHHASLKEIEQRFVLTAHRKYLFGGLRRLLESLQNAGCTTFYLDGSFITKKEEPGDYDCIWDPTGVTGELDKDLLKSLEVRKAKYFGDIFVYIPEHGGFPYLEYFQKDKDDNPKGIIKIDLRKPL